MKHECMDSDGKIHHRESEKEHDTWEQVAVDAKLVIEDPVSEKGHETFLPRGAVLRELLYQYLYDLHAEEEAFFLRTPLLCDYSNEAVRNHAELSGEGIYHTTSSDNEHILKHGTLFTQLQLLSQEPIDPKTLPVKMFEIADCHRIEANTRLLNRTRQFSMIDMHILHKDMHDCKEDAKRIYQKIRDIFDNLGLELEAEYTVEEELMHDDLPFLTELVRVQGEPVWIKRGSGGKRRPLNVEFYSAGIEVAAFQIDRGNPEKFGLTLENEETPLLMHVSFAGSIERLLFALMKYAKTHMLPVWLAPEQVRILGTYTHDVDTLVRSVQEHGVRVTVDDRDMEEETKRRLAEKALIPIVIQKENDGFRVGGRKVDDLYAHLVETVSNRYQLRATYPARLSRWPKQFRV